MKNIFITGATGFLGSYIMREILDNSDARPVVLARGRKRVSAQDRVSNVFKYFYGDNYKEMLKRVKIIEGEVDKDSLGLDNKDKDFLLSEVDEIYHSAAIAEFRIPLDKIRKINVNGTKNLLDLAISCKGSGRLKKVNHISTTYVAGDRKGKVKETELNMKQGFHNTYEQSKFEAELLVHDYRKKDLDIDIFRPSILIGDSKTGRTSNFKMLYQPLHFLANELFDALPANPDCPENLMPVDVAARQIYLLATKNYETNRTYHISNITTVRLGHFIDVAVDFFGFQKPELIPDDEFDMGRLTFVQKSLIDPYVPYFNYKTEFEPGIAIKLLDKSEHGQKVDDKLLTKLFEYCIVSGFIKEKKRKYVIAG